MNSRYIPSISSRVIQTITTDARTRNVDVVEIYRGFLTADAAQKMGMVAQSVYWTPDTEYPGVNCADAVYSISGRRLGIGCSLDSITDRTHRPVN